MTSRRLVPYIGNVLHAKNYVARFAGSGILFSAYPQLALWAASFAGPGLFFSISGSRDRPSATGAKAHGLTLLFNAALKGRSTTNKM